MKKKSGGFLDFILFIPVFLVLELTRMLPRPVGYALWKGVSLLAYTLTGSRMRIMRENLSKAFPGRPHKELEEIGKNVYLNLGRVYAEFCKIGTLNRGNVDEFVIFDGLENLEGAYGKGKGVIITTMHYYNAELLTGALAVKGFPVHWIIREVDNFYIDRKMNAIREGSGMKAVSKEGALREMIRAIRAGEVVSVTTDQKASFNEVWVKFLGRWSATVRSPAVISLRTGAAIVPMFSVPQTDNSHRAYFLPAIKYEPTGDAKKDVFAITQIIADLQSEFITRHPELWFWLHRKWSMKATEAQEIEAEAMLQGAIKAGLKTDRSFIK